MSRILEGRVDSVVIWGMTVEVPVDKRQCQPNMGEGQGVKRWGSRWARRDYVNTMQGVRG